MSQQYRPGDTAYLEFTVTSGTGALVNADSLPTAKIVRNGAMDSAVTVTVNAALQAGVYAGSYTVPASYAVGDTVRVLVLATVGGVSTGRFIGGYRLVSWPPNALPNAAAGAAGGVLTVGTGTGQVNPSGGAIAVSDKTGFSLAGSQTFDLTGNIVGSLSGSVGAVTGLSPSSIAGSILATPAQKIQTDSSGSVLISGAQVVPQTGNTGNSVFDCLNAARAQGFGRWSLSGTTLSLFGADGSTVVRTFTLDSASAPTQRS